MLWFVLSDHAFRELVSNSKRVLLVSLNLRSTSEPSFIFKNWSSLMSFGVANLVSLFLLGYSTIVDRSLYLIVTVFAS